jgi:bacteriocin leader peptide (microcyclamide/patellamide family)
MDKKNIIPQQSQPVVRFNQGTQTNLLTELSEENLGATAGIGAAKFVPNWGMNRCSYDCDDGMAD